MPSALGSESFLAWVKGTFFSGTRHKEVPESRALSPDAERIKEEVCRNYGVERVDLYRSKRGILNEPRNIAIYLLRTMRGDNLEDIGREFNTNESRVDLTTFYAVPTARFYYGPPMPVAAKGLV